MAKNLSYHFHAFENHRQRHRRATDPAEEPAEKYERDRRPLQRAEALSEEAIRADRLRGNSGGRAARSPSPLAVGRCGPGLELRYSSTVLSSSRRSVHGR